MFGGAARSRRDGEPQAQDGAPSFAARGRTQGGAAPRTRPAAAPAQPALRHSLSAIAWALPGTSPSAWRGQAPAVSAAAHRARTPCSSISRAHERKRRALTAAAPCARCRRDRRGGGLGRSRCRGGDSGAPPAAGAARVRECPARDLSQRAQLLCWRRAAA